jgi:hypothetical protein
MSRSRHTEAQMIGALKQLEAGRKAEDVAREVGVSKHTVFKLFPQTQRMISDIVYHADRHDGNHWTLNRAETVQAKPFLVYEFTDLEVVAISLKSKNRVEIRLATRTLIEFRTFLIMAGVELS